MTYNDTYNVTLFDDTCLNSQTSQNKRRETFATIPATSKILPPSPFFFSHKMEESTLAFFKTQNLNAQR